MKMRRISKYLFFSLVLTACFFLLNRQVPFFSDDLGWINSIQGESFLDKIESVFEVQKRHWLTQNGRITCHAFLQCVAGNGELAYDLFISILFGLSILLFNKLFDDKDNKSDILIFALIAIVFLYLSPSSTTNFYWAAGGCNYLLPVFFSLGFLCCINYLKTRNFDNYLLPFVALFSFIAGWTHEIFALPISFALFCMIIYNICKGKHLSKQHFCLIIPFWLGALLIVVSPGTIARIAGNGGAEGATFLSALLAKAVTSFKIFRYGRCFYVLLALLIYLALSKKKSLVEFVKDNVFLCLCCLGSLGIVVILGVGGRAVWGVEVFSLLIIIKWVNSVLAHSDKSAVWNKIGAVLAVIIIVHQACLIKPFKESWDTYRAVVEQTKQSNFEGTASMEQWKSDNPLIDPFVAHPYEMMMEDMWMRIPLHCNVCRTDVYDYLKKNGGQMTEKTVMNIDGDFVVPLSEEIEKAVRAGAFEMKLKPITYTQQGSLMYLSWHQLLQKMWPERYPKTISAVYEDEVSCLSVGGRQYLRFEKPVRPVYREIESVIIY